MNSYNKYHEIGLDKALEYDKVSGASAIIAAKIQHQIKGYQYRKLSAQDEIADLSRVGAYMTEEGLNRSAVRSRLLVLRQEIDFCNSQIKAYQENDNKAKIIPDRLL